MNPIGLDQLRQDASEKLRQLNHVAREKKQWDQTVSNIKSIKQAREKKNQLEEEVRKQFPAGDKPVV